MKATSTIRPLSPGPGAELSRKWVFSGMLLRVVWYPRTAFCGFVLIGLVFFRTYTNLKPDRKQALCVRTLKNLRMSKRMKLGRPPLPEGASREGRLFCRLLLSEVEEIERAAKAAKKSKSDWIRETLLAAARKAPGR